jgi:hypothetical protein
MNRLSSVNSQVKGPNVSAETVSVDGVTYPEVIDYHPHREVKYFFFNKQGWGYKDSGFIYDDKT